MNKNLRSFLPLLGVVCTSMLSQTYADDYTNGQDCCVKMKTAIPPGVNCPCDCGPNVYINAAYTLWTAREEGLAVAYANNYACPTLSHTNSNDCNNCSDVASGKIVYPDWKLRSGFKVGIGAYLDHDCWDIGLEYTWFYNKNNKFKTYHCASGSCGTTSDDCAILSLWAPTGPGYYLFANGKTPAHYLPTSYEAVATRWNNWLNRIDGTLGRAFYVGHYLSFRPFMGLLGAWDDQDLDVNYINDPASTNPNDAQTSLTNKSRFSQNWWGIGPYGGFDSTFVFCNDDCSQWSLFLDTGFALPWGRYKTKANNKTVLTTPTTTSCDQQVDECCTLRNTGSFYNVDPVLEMSLGLRWEMTWSDASECSFLVQAAWEEQVWFNHNKMTVLSNSNGGTNYTMQGLTLKFQLDF